MRDKDQGLPNYQKDYYSEVSNQELYNRFRSIIIFCLRYLRKHITEKDMRDFSKFSFASDKTREIESSRDNIEKRLKRVSLTGLNGRYAYHEIIC